MSPADREPLMMIESQVIGDFSGMTRMRCEDCGWVGPWRSADKLHLVSGDRADHVFEGCEVPDTVDAGEMEA